ncbi:hypothetical protein NM208_g5898 [Fusarium decemcellulare]|uniref:Uncharacterized protein n=1 Tax=Fusarium decemcellulare TaxID=57161 RepID=A0ACC1SFA4_9HYPO|nr:hypothetical protein NM208_g5898 [Fusarium decemcellulare]
MDIYTQDVLLLMEGEPLKAQDVDLIRDRCKRRSLLLDSVMQQRPRSSDSRLVQLPAEILADVVDLLIDDKPTLGSLALVNSDCRWLAHCGQFAEVHFNFSDQACELFEKIGGTLNTQAGQPSIAACVRRVSFQSSPQYLRERYSELWATIGQPEYSPEDLAELRQEANDDYRSVRAQFAETVSKLPNLDTLVWADDYPIDKDSFGKITRSHARHVKLTWVKIDQPWSLEPPLTPATWPIRSLHLELQPSFDIHKLQETSSTYPMNPFFASFFRLCAPTLESLAWRYVDTGRQTDDPDEPNEPALPISFGNNPVPFPRLRHLHLPHIDLDDVAFTSMLSPRLSSLTLSRDILERYTARLQTHGPFRDLKQLAVPSLSITSGPCARLANFIAQHSDLRSLYVDEDTIAPEHLGSGPLDSYIIPVLASHSFDNLRSLFLAWDHSNAYPGNPNLACVPEAALAAIGRLASLEQLSLRAGMNYSTEQFWPVEHDKLRAHLRGLKRLRKLALTRDTYAFQDVTDEWYYARRFVDAQHVIDAEARPELDSAMDLDDPEMDQVYEGQELDMNAGMEMEVSHDKIPVWERAHRNHMLTHAEAWAAVLPELEWVLFGQRPIGIERNPENTAAPRRAVPLTTKRYKCTDFLDNTFMPVVNDSY